MKRFYILVMLLALPILASSQTPSGAWLMSVPQSVQLMQASVRDRYDNLSSEIRQRITSRFDGREFVFNTDGSALIKWQTDNTNKEVAGTWSYQETENELTIVAEGREHTYDITQLTSSVMVLRMNNSTGIFTELYLNRKP
jgi:hypothetical protein